MTMRYVCRTCESPCRLDIPDNSYEPYYCPFDNTDADWEKEEVKE